MTAARNVIPFRRQPVHDLAQIMGDVKRRQMADEAARLAFNDEPFEFVPPLPRDDAPRFIDLRDGGNMHDYSNDGPGVLGMLLVVMAVFYGLLALVVWWLS